MDEPQDRPDDGLAEKLQGVALTHTAECVRDQLWFTPACQCRLPDWAKIAEVARAHFAQAHAEDKRRDEAGTENIRLAREHQQVHDWNMKLVGEHYELCGRVRELESTLAQAQAERDAWIETARQETRNRDYYRSLVVEIGELFGVAAKTADDGGISEDVLCAKVPELVRQAQAAASESARTLQVEVLAMRETLARVREGLTEAALVRAIKDQYCGFCGKTFQDHLDQPHNHNFDHVAGIPLQARAIRALVDPASERKTFWLVERVINGQAHWLAWRGRDHLEWVTEVANADQYDWSIAASREARLIAASQQIECFATEHMWMDPASEGKG